MTLPAPTPLPPKHLQFVVEYLKDFNATQAAIRAGYSRKGAAVQGVRLLTNAKVAAELARRTERRLERAELTADRVLEELRRLAFFDVRQLFDDRGNVLPITELSAEVAAAIAGLEVILKNAKAGDGVVDEVLKLKLADKTKALEMLGKHFGILVERVEVRGAGDILARLAAGRARIAKRSPSPA